MRLLTILGVTLLCLAALIFGGLLYFWERFCDLWD